MVEQHPNLIEEVALKQIPCSELHEFTLSILTKKKSSFLDASGTRQPVNVSAHLCMTTTPQ